MLHKNIHRRISPFAHTLGSSVLQKGCAVGSGLEGGNPTQKPGVHPFSRGLRTFQTTAEESDSLCVVATVEDVPLL
jgi:hypothetical protein